MKKSITILFTFLYLISSSGIMVGQHLCMGRVKEVSFFSKVKKDCGMPIGMHDDLEDCCKDELVLEIIEDAQQQTLSQEAPLTDFVLLSHVALVPNLNSLFESQYEVIHFDNGPPDLVEPSAFILFQCLKIPGAFQS